MEMRFMDNILRHRCALLCVLVLLVNVYVLTQFNLSSPTPSSFQVHPPTPPSQVHPVNSTTTPLPPLPPPTINPTSPIVFSLVMFGTESATEGLLALKSVIMYASAHPLDFHIITSEDAIPILQSRFELISRPAFDVRVWYYPLTKEQIRARAGRAGVDTKYIAGMGGLAKVFIHELLPPTVPRAIFFDTDMLFVTDPYLLWSRFNKFTPQQMISFTDLGPNSAADVICSCVMLLDLEKLRSTERPLMGSTYFGRGAKALGTREVFVKHGIDPKNPEFGDQGLYWAIWMEYREYFAHLSIGWDTSHCRFSYGMTLAGSDTMSEAEHIASQADTRQADEATQQLFPGILHFNCQENIVWDDAVNVRRKRWGAYVSLAKDYKWIWFNKGDGSAHTTTETIPHTVFWDERVRDMIKGGGTRHREKNAKARLSS